MKINSFNTNQSYQSKKSVDEGTVNRNANALRQYADKNSAERTDTSKKQAQSSSGDILDISKETQNMISVRKKIETGFYDKPAVLATVANKIINSDIMS